MESWGEERWAVAAASLMLGVEGSATVSMELQIAIWI
jgi:hypothetical protein